MKCLVILCLIYLLVIEDTNAWRRRRWRRAWRRVENVGKRVFKATKKVAAVVAKTREGIDAAKNIVKGVLGKRSVTEVMPELNLCDFSSLDHDQDDVISEEEIATMIEITGLTDFDEFFGQMDKNEDGRVNITEYNTADVILESCSPE